MPEASILSRQNASIMETNDRTFTSEITGTISRSRCVSTGQVRSALEGCAL